MDKEKSASPAWTEEEIELERKETDFMNEEAELQTNLQIFVLSLNHNKHKNPVGSWFQAS